MSEKLKIFIVFILLTSCGSDSNSSITNSDISSSVCGSNGDTATVTKIIDGDTIDIQFANGLTDTVRYIGINTPEVGQQCASEATELNRSLVDKKEVLLIQDVSNRDDYNRLLRYVCVDGNYFVNALLVSNGYAEAVAYPPDTKYSDYLESLENIARDSRRGCLYRDSSDTGGSTGGGSGGSSGCCKICRNSKACGDSCISLKYTCNKPAGCACNG